MIVIDASAMVEALIGRDIDPRLLDALTGDVHAPHLLDVDVLTVLRGLVLGGKLSTDDAVQAQATYFALALTRHVTEALAPRIWALRTQFTAYDATYVALAQALDAGLHTCDAKLRRKGHQAVVVLHPGAR